jgi:hypothetical protein
MSPTQLASNIVENLKAQPFVLVLLLINVIALAGFAFTLHEVGNAIERRDRLTKGMHREERTAMIALLKRLPIIRHLRWLYLSWRVEQHYAMWAQLGIVVATNGYCFGNSVKHPPLCSERGATGRQIEPDRPAQWFRMVRV